ncbi:uncharacterized protein LOC108667135 [Hyalella azteca]|uniref:Uncharacterized protein LOC108667135 n=1 Tax=Hyalella azteca TaxID=294128 RepID=A0A8B7N7K6_HYAAZ|nr:uncharacterized protein LOC108667135 [Hyalella azteca]
MLLLEVVALLLTSALYITSARHSDQKEPPLYAAVPDTSFSCSHHMAGYYADMEAGCQVYHMCDTLGKQYSYLCPNMTVFNQRFMVCDHWHYVNCSNSNAYYNLNARMAGGGKKVPTPGRRGSFVDNMEENDIDDADVRKVTPLTITDKKVAMKIKNTLRSQEKKISTTTPKQTTPSKRLQNITDSMLTGEPPTTRSSLLRPLTTSSGKIPTSLDVDISSSLPTVRPISTDRRRTTFDLKSTFSALVTTPSPLSTFSLSSSTSTTEDSNQFTKSTQAQPAVRQPILTLMPPIISRSRIKPFAFPMTEIHNFSELNKNRSAIVSLPAFQMFPGLVARGSGPRFGFGSTHPSRRPAGHGEIPPGIEFHPLVLEISRQLSLPKVKQSPQEIDETVLGSEEQTGSNSVVGRNFSDTEEVLQPFTVVINPPNGRNIVSFPIQPLLVTQNLSPLVDPRIQQEDITVLESKKNGRDRINNFKIRSQRPSISSNQAFFIPETDLIPPDDILIETTDPNSAKLDIPESSTEAPLQDHHNMTMIFPDAKQVNFTQLFGGLIVNPNCPECHPAFLTPGKCTPCVRIR